MHKMKSVLLFEIPVGEFFYVNDEIYELLDSDSVNPSLSFAVGTADHRLARWYPGHEMLFPGTDVFSFEASAPVVWISPKPDFLIHK